MISIEKNYTLPSSSGLADINIVNYYPAADIAIKGVIQIAHGMAEHLERYADFIDFLSMSGYVVFINDHLGHGKSVASDADLGFFGETDGDLNLVNDMKLVTDLAKSKYPDVPYILFGHSMGSFLSRLYTELYGDELTMAIYCGTAGANPAAGIGAKIASLIAKTKGSHYRSTFINSLAFGSYNKRCRPQRTDYDWLTKENSVVDEYIKDDYCGFLFTADGYKDLFTLLKKVNREDWFTSFDSSLPLMLIAGEEDPVGAYGAGVREVYDKLVATGHSNVSIKLYPGDRHEILNETDKKTVYSDILTWINQNLEGEA